MGWSAFSGKGLTQSVAVTTTASVAIQAPGFPGEQNNDNYLLVNTTTQPVWVGVGTASAFLAVIPVPGTGQRGYWLGPSASISVSESYGAWFSVIAPATTSTVLITPGDGL